ncbi:ABC transporter permease [Pseudoduganella sp. DS3]|uniref:ABC transporter permease n=2 Tax=Pseudoduganella guangdongensis TaxID=2692179 RepID=A0A6N9HFH3_9BURK|nr:ABC transporter permease [Pseudoduganella guangdongensis]
MMPQFLVVMKKELVEAIRDKRTLNMLLMFVFMYPAMVGFMLHMQIKRGTSTEKVGIDMVVVGAAQAPNLVNYLTQKNVNVTPKESMSEADIAKLLSEKKTAAVLKLGEKFSEYYEDLRPAPLELWFDSSVEKASQRRELETMLREYGNGIAGARLLAHGVSPATLSPLALQRYDTADSTTRSNTRIGMFLGMFFVPACIFGLAAAIDSTAGERERRSLEVLISQPMRAFDLVAGKWLAASALAAIGLAFELGVAHAVLKYLPLEEIGLSWRVDIPMLLLVIATAIPLCLMIGALQVAMAMNSRTFKEAQATAGIVTFIPMLPVFIVPALDLTTKDWMYAVPLLGNQTMFQAMATGQSLGVMPYLLACALPLVLAFAAVAFATRRMSSEKYVLGV